MAANFITNLKDVVIPFLSALGIKILTGNSDYIHVEIEVNSVGFYILIVLLSVASVISLSKLRLRIKRLFKKAQVDHTDEIKKRCKDDRK